MSETPSKKDICIDVIRLILASELVACSGTFFSANVSHRYYTGTLDEIVRREPPCDVCALGALFYSNIRGTPLSMLCGRRGAPAWLDEDGSDLFAGGGGLLSVTPPKDRPEPYRIPFTCQELSLFEKAFEGDGCTLTHLRDQDLRMQALSWHEAIMGAVNTEDNDYPERDLMLQLMANAVEHDGVPDVTDMRVRTEDEIKKLAGSPSSKDLPTQGITLWIYATKQQCSECLPSSPRATHALAKMLGQNTRRWRITTPSR